VTNIGDYSFYYCQSLTNVTLGNAVMNIGKCAFYGCSQLPAITLPATVLTVSTQAFAVCSALTTVFFAGNAPAIGSNPFLADHATIYYLTNTTGWTSPFARMTAVLWNPVIQTGGAGLGVQGNQFILNITGTASIPIVVEATTNLANPVWVPVLSAGITNGSIPFADPLQGRSRRFYRIRSP
jgi:hypothetical protein